MIVYALTHSPGGIKDVIKTPVKIQNTFSKAEINTLAIWDTGATNCVVTKSIALQLGLPVVSRTKVRGVHGEKEVNVYLVHITLNNQNITLQTLVTECEELSESNDTGMLIGMDLISKGDFSISTFEGNTVMTFRTPSIECIDYVQEISEFNRCLKVHENHVRNNYKQDKCACGSGKDFKNCHGKSKYNK
ncbi:aspartyl protease family protein [Sodaliphilus sp.]|uniref:aspartyl protease family protein n=1 Tax=Sodaliphilus sp. TaxID=2815818 RepID=UPI00388E7085